MTDEVTSAADALLAMGIDPDEAAQVDLELRGKSGVRDNRICLCGHGVSKHLQMSGAVYCKPSRMECPCKVVRPVLEAEDTRAFLRKTVGAGAMHALARGLSSLRERGKSGSWIVDLKCDRCGSEESPIVPVPVTKNGVAVSEATGYDALLCVACRQEV